MESIIEQVITLLLTRKPNGDNMFTRAEVISEATRLQAEANQDEKPAKGAPCGRPHCLAPAEVPAEQNKKPKCPTCGAGIKLTERRPNGDRWCVVGHKHKTAAFYRPAPKKADEPEGQEYAIIKESNNRLSKLAEEMTQTGHAKFADRLAAEMIIILGELNTMRKYRPAPVKESPAKEAGLYMKYHVSRVDGKDMPEGCIVLEWKDKNALAGIAAFSQSVRTAGYTALANDLDKRLDDKGYRPAPSRTGELVRKLRESLRVDGGNLRERIANIIGDFEGGA